VAIDAETEVNINHCHPITPNVMCPMVDHKRFNDMAPEERHRDRLRHFPTMLKRWRGGRAQLWNYSISLHVLTLRIEHVGVQGNLQIGCASLNYIRAPEHWENCNIEIDLVDGDSQFPDFVVRDRNADVEIICGVVEVAENVKPVYEPQP
jgi:hypothetical protein